MITKYILPLLFLSIAYAQSPGDLDPNFIASENFNQLTAQHSVYTIKQDSQNNIYVGGEFEISSNGNTFVNLIKLTEDGSIDETFLPLALNASIRDFAFQDDGKVLVAIFGYADGYTYGDEQVNAIIRLNTDGSLDETFNFTSDNKEFGWKVVLLDNGEILACGLYGFFVRLNSSGDLVKDYNPNNSVYGDDALKDLYVVDENHLLIGGGLRVYDGQTRKYYAKIEMDGTLDETFDLSNELTNIYDFGKMVLLPDGDILAAVVDQSFISSVIKLNSNGIKYSEEEFQTPAPLDNVVYNMAHIANGRFVVTSTANPGVPLTRIFFLKADGSLDNDYNVVQGFNNSSFALFVQEDGKILTGGEFTTYNEQYAPRIARLLGNSLSVNSYEHPVKNIAVYPNPANDILHVENVSNNAEYYILNMNGRMISKGDLKNKTINISKLQKGQYILSAEGTSVPFLVK